MVESLGEVVMMPNLHLILGGLAVVAVLGAAAFLYHAGGESREDKITIQSAETVETVMERKNEIRNNRPDRAAVIDSLRRGTF